MKITRLTQRTSRKNRIRARLVGTTERPRLAIFRSNQFLYAQCVDDTTGNTIFTAKGAGKSVPHAEKLGADIAEIAKKHKITTIVFDRGGHMYHGNIKALADAIRKGGITF